MSPSSSVVSPPTRMTWIITLICTFYFFYVIVDGTLFNIIGADIIKTFNLTSTGLGTFSSVFLWANALWLIPAGLIYDKYSIRYIIILNFSLSVLSSFVFALSPWLWVDIFCRIIAGMSSAFGFLGCLRLAVMLFPPAKSAFVIGIIVTLGMCGGIFTNTVFTHLTIDFGWRMALLSLSVMGVLLLLSVIAVLHTPMIRHLEKIQRTNEQSVTLLKKILIVLKNRQNWIIGTYIGLLNLPIMMLAPLWLSWYLRQVYNLTLSQAANLTGILFVGEIIGSTIIGWLANKTMQFKTIMFIGAFLSILAMSVIIYVPHLTIGYLYALLFLLGFLVSVQVLGYPIIAEHNPTDYVSTAQGVASTLVNIINALFKPLFGWLLTVNWTPVYQDGLPLYQVSNYSLSLLLLPLAFMLAMLLCACIKPKQAEAKVTMIIAEN